MFKLLQIIKKWISPDRRSGSTWSSNAPESDFRPRNRRGSPRTGFTITVDDEAAPDGDGWIREKGRDPYRIIKCGQGAEMVDDEGAPRRRKVVSRNDPFQR